MEGRIHRDMFSVFYGVWNNPDTKIYQIVKYILSTSSENSRTWAINLRHVCRMYNLEDPVSSLQRDPPTKSNYKEEIVTKITVFHEKELKNKAQTNDLMQYMNVSLSSLKGRHHPCLANIVTTQEVKKLRPYLKLLTGDYLTYQRKYDDSGQGSPHCRVCLADSESVSHIVAICPQYQDTRLRILLEIQEQCLLAKTNIHFQDILSQPEVLTQFILDPTSFNLRNRIGSDRTHSAKIFSKYQEIYASQSTIKE